MKPFSRKYSVACCALFAVVFSAFSQTASTTLVPIQLIGGLPYIEVSIAGKGPFLFGFDSGFGGEMELDSELASTLQISASGSQRIGDGSGQNEANLPTALVKNTSVGNYHVAQTVAVLRRNARSNIPGMENVKGILGMRFFGQRQITIDYPKLLFGISSESLPKANNTDVFDYSEVGGGVPMLQIKIGNSVVNAVVDSRSMSGSFKIPQGIAEKLTFITTPKLVGQGRTISSTIDINQVQVAEAIIFGKFVFEKPTITFPALNENAIIGAGLLRKFAITIDIKHHRIRFVEGEPSKTGEKLAQYTGQFGDRTVSADGNSLYIQRPGGMLLRMLPKSGDEFGLEAVAGATLKFGRDAAQKIISLQINKGDGQWEVAEKSNP